jgi:leader peptidase (prepilin peptidase)/N-methyltransferase
MFVKYLVLIVVSYLIGNITNFLIERLPKEKINVKTLALCDECSRRLGLLNVLLNPFSKKDSNCSICNQRPIIKPLIIAFTISINIVFFNVFGFNINFFKYSLLSITLLIMTFIDLNHSIIPDTLNAAIAIIGLIFMFITKSYIDSFFGLLMGGGVFFLIVLISYLILKQEGMGMGDVKLMSGLGLIMGFKNTLLIFILSFLIGAIISIILLAVKKKTKKDYIPFGPFIAMATYLTIFYKDIIITWYLKI